MIYLSHDDHLKVAARVIGSQPLVRDHGLLEAAAFRPQASVFGADAYPTLWDKAAAMMESLARNHPLVDGNKRLALAGTVVFLGMNGFRLTMNNDEAYDFTIKVSTGEFESVAVIAQVLRVNTKPR
jgi:death-on-curing protein